MCAIDFELYIFYFVVLHFSRDYITHISCRWFTGEGDCEVVW